MKTIVKRMTLLLLASIVLVACSDEQNLPDETAISTEDNTRAAQADNAVEGALTILENGYVEVEENGNRQTSFFPECTTITITTNGNGGTIVLDFGTGCTLNNGAFVTGSVLLEYGPIVEGTRTIDYTYTNFTYNGNGVTGGGQVFREISNENGNPQSTVNAAITVTFPNTDVVATRTGVRIAEWVEGFASGTWEDNVYHVTGNWTTQLTNGFERTGEVTEVLVRKLSCPYLVSGTLDIVQNNLSAQINFGDGSCDNQATLIIAGTEIDIILGN